LTSSIKKIGKRIESITLNFQIESQKAFFLEGFMTGLKYKKRSLSGSVPNKNKKNFDISVGIKM